MFPVIKKKSAEPRGEGIRAFRILCMFCLQLLHPHLGRGLIFLVQRRCSIRRDIIQMHCVQVLVLAHIITPPFMPVRCLSTSLLGRIFEA